MKAADIVHTLKAAREYLSDRKRWIQYHWATTKNGFPLSGGADPDVEHVCMIGAVEKVRGVNFNHTDNKLLYDPVVAALGVAVLYTQPWVFNDSPRTSYEDVMAGYDKAIEQQCEIVRKEAREAGLEVEDKK